jgi:hypothetical protein
MPAFELILWVNFNFNKYYLINEILLLLHERFAVKLQYRILGLTIKLSVRSGEEPENEIVARRFFSERH